GPLENGFRARCCAAPRNDRYGTAGSESLTASSKRGRCGAAVAVDMKDARRSLAEDRAALGRTQRRRFDDRARIGVADAEGIIRSEHDALGADDIAKKAQGARLEQDGVEIQPAETVDGIGVFFMDRMVALQASERIGERAAGM